MLMENEDCPGLEAPKGIIGNMFWWHPIYLAHQDSTQSISLKLLRVLGSVDKSQQANPNDSEWGQDPESSYKIQKELSKTSTWF